MKTLLLIALLSTHQPTETELISLYKCEFCGQRTPYAESTICDACLEAVEDAIELLELDLMPEPHIIKPSFITQIQPQKCDDCPHKDRLAAGQINLNYFNFLCEQCVMCENHIFKSA